MSVLYTASIFVGAALLFLVQPMFARMILPVLGGSPAVWNTCVVFFQAALLLGYVYAYAGAARLAPRAQAVVHVAVLLLAAAFLPIAVRSATGPSAAGSPVGWLLAALAVSLGLPFFALAATSPLLQRWFTSTRQHASSDPYFLYAASNAGSMAALLGYPLVMEPYLRLHDQSRLWSGGYWIAVALTAVCAFSVERRPTAIPARSVTRIEPRRVLRWVALAFVPSSMMLSVTTYVATEIESVPLLWVIPLGVYLLTFMLVFARRPPLPHRIMARALPLALLPLVVALVKRANHPMALMAAVHLTAFFCVAMVCHGELAHDRPPAGDLTRFYLCIAIGGVLGGVFNALVAPVVFSDVVEYPATVVLACLLAPGARGGASTDVRRDALLAAVPALLLVGLRVASDRLGWGAHPAAALVFGIPALVCFGFSRRPTRFGLGVAGLLGVAMLHPGERSRVLAVERSFFGINTVVVDGQRGYHLLFHGTTLHGMQDPDPSRRREPLTYYHPSGPLGAIFEAREARRPDAVAVIGLGAGAIACYVRPGERWDFYEIDPTVVRIARDPRLFTYLADCLPAANVTLGDARLSLARSNERYGLIVLDAYSSDAIPIHLLTREALRVYLARLADHGLLAFHLSNRHLDLVPILVGLARDAGLTLRVRAETSVSLAETMTGKLPSRWAVMARRPEDLGTLVVDARWAEPPSDAGLRTWTDDYSSVLTVLRWF